MTAREPAWITRTRQYDKVQEANSVHIGINIMQKRARHTGGGVCIDNFAGRRARARLRIPACDTRHGLKS